MSTKQHSELIFIFSIHYLHSILLKIPDKLSTCSDNEVDINLKLSVNFSFYVIVLPLSLSHSVLIGTEKLIHFSILSPMQLISPLNSFAI